MHHNCFTCTLASHVCPNVSEIIVKDMDEVNLEPNHNKHTLQWRHNERDGVSNHQPHDCLLNRLFRHRSKETSKLRVTGLCEGNSPVTGEFTAQRASNAENVSICWRHHAAKRTIRQFLGCTVYADTLRSLMQWCLKGPNLTEYELQSVCSNFHRLMWEWHVSLHNICVTLRKSELHLKCLFY